MSADPNASMLSALNDFLGSRPEFASLFPRAAGFRYWVLTKKASGGRWERWYAWTPKRANGPDGGKAGFYALEYVKKADGAHLVRSVRFARRRLAKARALAWYEAAKRRSGVRTRPPSEAKVAPRVAPLPEPPTCPGCDTSDKVEYYLADRRFYCSSCDATYRIMEDGAVATVAHGRTEVPPPKVYACGDCGGRLAVPFGPGAKGREPGACATCGAEKWTLVEGA